MKPLRNIIAAASLLLLFTTIAQAQGLNIYFGMGSARDGVIKNADGTPILVDLLGTGNPLPATSLGGVFGTIGGGVMLSPRFGFGAEVSFRFAQQDYGNTGYRPIFYDFNGIATPSLGSKRIVPEFQAGLGGVNNRFYGGTQYYDYYSGRYTNFAGSVNKFQLHAGAGLRIFVKDNLFVRPTFDYHWVRGLNDFFNSDNVVRYSVAIGFATRQ